MKTILYEQVSRIGKAISSPKRLELLELLVQGEKTVEKLADLAHVDVKLASAHLKALREARLVGTRRDGKYVHYRLTNDDVADLLVKISARTRSTMALVNGVRQVCPLNTDHWRFP